ncbi:MAG: FUSC family protein [Deltaproteobacteria bacterium]|nr:FUSC family protein [Deltaproteobacteria bacterium]
MPPAARYSIRAGLAVSAAIWLANAPGLIENHSTWILITVLMLLQPTTGASLQKGLLRAVASVAAAFTAIALFGLFAQDPPLLMAGLFVVQVLAAYGNSGTRFQYAWFVWAFTTAIVVADSMAGSTPVETVAFERASMVAIGVVLVMVVDVLFWRERAEPRLRESLARRARRLGEALERVLGGPGAPGTGDASEPGALAGQLPLLDAARTELAVSAADMDALGRVAMLLETIASRARVLAGASASARALDEDDPGYAAALKQLAAGVSAALAEVAEALVSARAPSRFSVDLQQRVLALEAERDRLARLRGGVAAHEGRAAEVMDLVSLLRAVEATLCAPVTAVVSERTSPRSFRPDPLRVQIALRSAVAVVAAFVVPMALGWPVNAMVAPIAFIVAATTRGAGLQLLAMLGAVVATGWLLADLTLVFVAPHLGRAPVMLVVPFVLGAALAYPATIRPQLAVLLSVGGLVALLSVFGGSAAPTDVYGPYNLVCYVALAAFIGWLASRLMWPATAAGLFRKGLAAQLERCLAALGDARRGDDADRDAWSASLARSSAVASAQLARLDQQARREPVEAGLDESLRPAVLPLLMDLSDAVAGRRFGGVEPLLQRGGSPMQPLADALERADGALLDSLRSCVAELRGEASRGTSSLSDAQQAVEDHLQGWAADPAALPELTRPETQRLLAEIDSRRRLVARHCALEQWFSDWRRAQAEQA